MGEGNEHTFKYVCKIVLFCILAPASEQLCKCHKEVIVKLQNQISEAYENIAVH